MNRDQLLHRIESRWAAFKQVTAGLPDDALQEPGVAGDWCVKDLIAHVAAWEEETLKALPVIMEGKRPPRYGDVDAFNARLHEANSRLSLDEARRMLESSHQRLLGFLVDVPERWYATETRFRHRLRLDTWGHYPEHTEAILAWRQARGL